MARAGRSVALLVVLALVAGGAWFFRGLIPGPWRQPPAPVAVSEAAADVAEEKLARLREDGDTVRLSGIEFTSYLRYRMADRFAKEIEVPSVSFAGDGIRVDGRVPKDRVSLGGAGEWFPDTVDVMVGGNLRTVAPGRAAVKVGSATFAKIPVPREKYLPVLARMRTPYDTALAEDEVGFQLPPGVGAARVENGELVLSR